MTQIVNGIGWINLKCPSPRGRLGERIGSGPLIFKLYDVGIYIGGAGEGARARRRARTDKKSAALGRHVLSGALGAGTIGDQPAPCLRDCQRSFIRSRCESILASLALTASRTTVFCAGENVA